jgi:hypothetical protein
LANEYIEHSNLDLGPLMVADATMQGWSAGGDGSAIRRCWVGSVDGIRGNWLTHSDFRALVADLVKFADALPPSGVPVDRAIEFTQQDGSKPVKGVALASGVEPCPRGADKPESTCTNRHQCWEPCGELGKSEEHARAVGVDTSRGGEHG